MDKKIFLEIVKKLNGINYFFISGLSVAIHTNGKRIPGDIDIAIHDNDINKFARLFGTRAKRRKIDKKTFIVEDYGFEFDFKGQMIEATSGYPTIRVKENNFNKLFDKKVKKIYEGVTVFVEPIEELLTQKGYMDREKDIADLKLLKDIKFDKKLLVKLAEDKGKKDEILAVLKREGFDI